MPLFKNEGQRSGLRNLLTRTGERSRAISSPSIPWDKSELDLSPIPKSDDGLLLVEMESAIIHDKRDLVLNTRVRAQRTTSTLQSEIEQSRMHLYPSPLPTLAPSVPVPALSSTSKPVACGSIHGCYPASSIRKQRAAFHEKYESKRRAAHLRLLRELPISSMITPSSETYFETLARFESEGKKVRIDMYGSFQIMDLDSPTDTDETMIGSSSTTDQGYVEENSATLPLDMTNLTGRKIEAPQHGESESLSVSCLGPSTSLAKQDVVTAHANGQFTEAVIMEPSIIESYCNPVQDNHSSIGPDSITCLARKGKESQVPTFEEISCILKPTIDTSCVNHGYNFVKARLRINALQRNQQLDQERAEHRAKLQKQMEYYRKVGSLSKKNGYGISMGSPCYGAGMS